MSKSSFANRMKRFFKEVAAFFTSRIFLANSLFIVGSLVILGALFFLSLKRYTRHGESIEVPDLVEMQVPAAERLLEGRTLEMEIIETLYNPEFPGGVIIDQKPNGGSRVKENRTIYVTVNSDEPPPVPLAYEDFIGYSLRHVERLLTTKNLKLGKTTYIEGKAENTIAKVLYNGNMLFKEVDPTKGEKRPEPRDVPSGSTIDLVLYKGLDAGPKSIPSFVCLTYAEAEAMIKMYQFNLGRVNIPAGVGSDTLSAWVYRQEPEIGASASLGTGINLWLTMDKPGACSEQ